MELINDTLSWCKSEVFGVMILGMLCLILSHAPTICTIGISLILFSFYVFVLDHFSEGSANPYYLKIVEHLSN